jgi:hypothetical protein
LWEFLEYDCVFYPLYENAYDMVYWTHFPWYFDPLADGISNPLPMVFWTAYPWHCEPHTYGISIPLPMVYWTHHPWYFNPLYFVYPTPAYLMIRNEGVQNTIGVQFTIQGVQVLIRLFNISWMKIDPWVNIPWASKYHMTPGWKYLLQWWNAIDR